MAKIRIKANAIVNILGEQECGQGDIIDVSDSVATHLVDEIQVAEYIEPVSKPEKPIKNSKEPAKTDDEAQNDD